MGLLMSHVKSLLVLMPDQPAQQVGVRLLAGRHLQNNVAQLCHYGIITTNRKSPVYQGLQVYGKVFHPFPNRKIEPRSDYIVGGVIVTTKTKYCLGGLSARPRNQDISSEKKKCPFFVPKIRCRQEEHNA